MMDGRHVAIALGLYLAVPVAGSIVAFLMILWHLFGPKDENGRPWEPKSNVVTCMIILGLTAAVTWILMKVF